MARKKTVKAVGSERPISGPALQADAVNRALRTFLLGLAVDVGVALGMIVLTAFLSAQSWGDLQWSILVFTLSKTGITTALSYVLRRFIDPSKIPTPLPPD